MKHPKGSQGSVKRKGESDFQGFIDCMREKKNGSMRRLRGREEMKEGKVRRE